MRIGFAKIEITPSLPVTLGGYEHRKREADNLHTPLYARCMTGESEGTQFAFISLDLLGIDHALREEVCAIGVERFGMHPQQISLIATHTHSAIDGIPDVLHKGLWTEDMTHIPTAYRQELVSLIVLGIEQSLASRREATMQWSVATCNDFASNRRDALAEAESVVYWLRVSDPYSNETLGGLLHFSCHPTVIGWEESVISGDFPGVAVAALEETYKGSVFLYANGAAGDISTRFTRQGSDSVEAERMGNHLVGSLQTSRPIPSLSRYTFLRDESPRLLDQRTGEWLVGYQQWIELGGMRLWLVPGEIFSSYARAATMNNQLIIGYANGYIGYIPDEQAWDLAGYEVEVCRISREDCRLFLQYARE
ncbi:neutral/alkaline non-lysosomal ceramidase N-terminal domain-containing protein [Paenibacillus qinlingensis]|uniref:Neutral/alkaline non-lysosomal ceramidase N-terminal domain-containing protein n=1 Tax=Paenibacillus qinlingensis TaxID=1837343 RepID=A0ABU1NQ90_9BACL|nr:neutral/alkaline non-lysosomal ceramidase N-terminal domain-containing protein [Paenibacillus qinlingensis]MDR6549182.1 hypothetical protein [Paenibacillus qinlingensis]